MFACALYPVNKPFLSNVYEEVSEQVKRLMSHPSIVTWAGNSKQFPLSTITNNRRK